MLAEGGCLCGAVRFGLRKEPQRVTVCHCQFCQRATGTAYMVEPIFSKADLVVTQGAPAIYDHRSVGSGQLVHIHFCPACGTKLWLTFDRWPDGLGLYAGTLDNPSWITIIADRAKHIFTDCARPDTLLPPHLPLYAQHAQTNDGEPCEPRILEHPMQAEDLNQH